MLLPGTPLLQNVRKRGMLSRPLLLQVRAKCLTTIAKVVYFAPPDMLTWLLKDIPLSSFLASLLASQVCALPACSVRPVLPAWQCCVWHKQRLRGGQPGRNTTLHSCSCGLSAARLA